MSRQKQTTTVTVNAAARTPSQSRAFEVSGPGVGLPRASCCQSSANMARSCLACPRLVHQLILCQALRIHPVGARLGGDALHSDGLPVFGTVVHQCTVCRSCFWLASFIGYAWYWGGMESGLARTSSCMKDFVLLHVRSKVCEKTRDVHGLHSVWS